MANTAPYNFVPLNDFILPAQAHDDGHHFYNPDLHSGYIDFSIKTLAPLLIKSDGKTMIKVNGLPIIPGSSLRGMVRNLMTIMGKGRIDMHDTIHFYRYASDGEYKKKFFRNPGGHQGRLSKPGFLYREKEIFKIIPLDNNTVEHTDKINLPDEFKFKPLTTKNIPKTVKIPIKIYNDEIIWKIGNMPPGGGRTGFHYWIFRIPEKSSAHIEIPGNIVSLFEEDTRTESINLIENLKSDHPNSIEIEIEEKKYKVLPCFYLDSEDKDNPIIGFGPTSFFRIDYLFSVYQYLYNTSPAHYFLATQSEDEEKSAMDFVSNVFGNTEKMGKIFFEDAIFSPTTVNTVENSFDEEQLHKELGSPKTTFEKGYLVPGKERDPSLILYNKENSKIRGYKQYWHRPGNQWFTTEENKLKQEKISPMKERRDFTEGRIRFVNLSDAELGLLLLALELPEGLKHKLGYGKPLGLGTIEINDVQVVKLDTQKRYSGFKKENGLIPDNEQKEHYKNSFISYLKSCEPKKFNFNDWKAYWKGDEQMKALEKLMTLKEGMKNNAWLDLTDYPNQNDFFQKRLGFLPHVDQVFNRLNGGQ